MTKTTGEYEPYHTPEQLKQRDAADQLEEIIIAARETVRLLRQGQAPRKAYALVYVVRGEVTKTLHMLGIDRPATDALRWARDVYDSQVL